MINVVRSLDNHAVSKVIDISVKMYAFHFFAFSGKVFVHCFRGVSRSATLVIVYIMCHQNLKLEDAIMTVRKKRAIFPNDGFLKQLIELHEHLSRNKEQT